MPTTSRYQTIEYIYIYIYIYIKQGADNSLALPGRKQAGKHVRDEREFNNIETLAVVKFFFLQGKAPKEIHAILIKTLACFLPGRAKDLSALIYICILLIIEHEEQ